MYGTDSNRFPSLTSRLIDQSEGFFADHSLMPKILLGSIWTSILQYLTGYKYPEILTGFILGKNILAAERSVARCQEGSRRVEYQGRQRSGAVPRHPGEIFHHFPVQSPLENATIPPFPSLGSLRQIPMLDWFAFLLERLEFQVLVQEGFTH